MSAFGQIGAILRKDILLELRSKEILSSMLVFSLIVVVIFNFIFDPGSEQIKLMAPGILWVAITFAGNLGLSRSFAREMEQGMLQGLLLCPVDRSNIFIAKLMGNVIFIALVQIIILPIIMVLFDLNLTGTWHWLLLIMLLGTLGFTGVGTVFATISANTKAREVMLPILLFPVSVPVILAATKSTAYLLAGRDFSQIISWIKLLIGFDIIFLVLCYLLYEYVLEE